MKKYKKIFIDYIKDHRNEFKYKKNCNEYGYSYIFTIPSPNKFLFIFPINFRFTIYTDPQDLIDGITDRLYFIDIDTVFWNGIRLTYSEDKEIIDVLINIFKETYKKHINAVHTNKFLKLIDLTKKK